MNKSFFVVIISIIIIIPIRVGIGLLINNGETSDLPFIIGVIIVMVLYMVVKPYVERFYEHLYPNG